jgi:hypothetical protein
VDKESCVAKESWGDKKTLRWPKKLQGTPKRAGVDKESWDDKRKLDGEGVGIKKAGVNKES